MSLAVDFRIPNSELAKIPVIIEEWTRGKNPIMQGIVAAKAKQVESFWKSIAPVSTGRPHPISKGSDTWDHPGDYRDSIKTRLFYSAKHGHGARVLTRDAKAAWIEYGTRFMPEQACAARTVEHFNHGGDTETAQEVISSE